MARSRAHHDTRAGGNADRTVKTASPKEKIVIRAPKKADCMVDTDEALGNKKAKEVKSAKKTAQSPDETDSDDSVTSESKPAKEASKIPADQDHDKSQKRKPTSLFPNLAKYARERTKAQSAQDPNTEDPADEKETQAEIDAQVTRRTAKMSEQIADLLRVSQDTWLQVQNVAEEFLDYAGYVGNAEDRDNARAKFDGFLKRGFEGNEWPARKRARREGDGEGSLE